MIPLKSPLYASWALAIVGILSLETSHAAKLPAGFVETLIATDLNPNTMTFAPDGRLILCEKNGLLRMVTDDKMLKKPLLDITDRVDSWNERGLQSVCFDPEFSSNGWIYLYYTHNRDPRDSTHQSSNNRVSRFTLKGETADPGSEVVLLEIDNLSKIGWHNGGGLAFGADGKIYVSTGENAKAPNAQNPNNLLGKLLRINKDGSIPADNPNYRSFKGKNRAIVALGLRNGYSIARQPDSGLLYLSEVGAKYEQIESYDSGVAPIAVNYGWPEVDGPPGKQNLPENYQPPVYAYDHGSGKGTAICGGTFYQPAGPGPDAFPPNYRGKFFFSDYGDWIKLIDPAEPTKRLDFASKIDRPIDVATAPDGSLWYIERAGIHSGSDEANTASTNGSLWRVSWTGGGRPEKLALIRQPESSNVGTPIGEVRVALQDGAGNIVSSATQSVTLSIKHNPAAGKLLGKSMVAAIDGIATFPLLAIDQAGNGYTLRATSGSLSVSSKSFDIESGVAAPNITPSGGRFSGPVWVQIASDTLGATIHVSRDGKDPDARSPVYQGPFEITNTTEIKAIAGKKGMRDSKITAARIEVAGNTRYGLNYRPPVTGINLPATADEGLPPTLSAVGIFTDKNLTPKAGIVPYSLNSTIWADGAEVSRWVVLPDSAKAGFSPSGEWSWPGGTVFVQHFEVVINGSTDARRRIETRLLVLDGTGRFGYGANYRWRTDESDADLVDMAGSEETLEVTDSSGTTREQTWMYPSRGLCYLCHTPTAGFVLGPKTHQLNGNFSYPGGYTDNQLRTWNYLQMLTPALQETAIKEYPRTCRVDDPDAQLEDRIRSYFDGNCSSCHRPGGTGAGWDARFETPLAQQGILNGEVRNTFGIEGARLVVPRDVSKSLMHLRMASTAPAEQMPPVTRNVVDKTAIEALEQWIRSSAE